uniref:Thiamine pyrophosphokinase n=1 Tax=Araucaria cunninghamii TaxID=56994 RepID=A0A0D6R2Q7_ARACU
MGGRPSKQEEEEEEEIMEVMQHSVEFLTPTAANCGGSGRVYALVVLNYELPSFTPALWNRAQLRLCADGGANRLFDQMAKFFPDEAPALVRQRFKPDVIKGDLDSIRPEVREFYDNMGSTILDESNDQDTTDLHKCVAFIKDCTPDLEKANLTVLVVGALGGRFDHELGNINVLYAFSAMRIVLLSNDSLLFLLPRTHCHEILVNPSVEGPHCGLIPLGRPSQSTTTSGLQWDLNMTPMGFGSLISTSNILKGEKVTVCSDVDLLWTTSIRKGDSMS